MKPAPEKATGPAVRLPFEEQGQSVAGWLIDAVDGNIKDYGNDLVNKNYD